MDRSSGGEHDSSRRHPDRRSMAVLGTIEHGDAHARLSVAARRRCCRGNRRFAEIQRIASLYGGPMLRRYAAKRMQGRVVAGHAQAGRELQRRGLPLRTPPDRNTRCAGGTHRIQLRRIAHRIVDGCGDDREIRPQRLYRPCRQALPRPLQTLQRHDRASDRLCCSGRGLVAGREQPPQRPRLPSDVAN